jgi:hypothetical protein
MRRPLASVALVAAVAAATSAPGSDYPPLFDDTPEVAAGTYMVHTESFGAPVRIAMPDGWTADADFVTWGPHSSYVAWWTPTAAPLDSCSWKLAPMTPVATAADLEAAMADQEQTLIGLPQPLTVGNATGIQFTVAANPFRGVDCDSGRQVIWQNETEGDRRWFNGAYDTFTVWALDLTVGLRAFTIGSAAPLLPDEQASCSTSPNRLSSSTIEARHVNASVDVDGQRHDCHHPPRSWPMLCRLVRTVHGSALSFTIRWTHGHGSHGTHSVR